jgi:hypothetical protein
MIPNANKIKMGVNIAISTRLVPRSSQIIRLYLCPHVLSIGANFSFILTRKRNYSIMPGFHVEQGFSAISVPL